MCPHSYNTTGTRRRYTLHHQVGMHVFVYQYVCAADNSSYSATTRPYDTYTYDTIRVRTIRIIIRYGWCRVWSVAMWMCRRADSSNYTAACCCVAAVETTTPNSFFRIFFGFIRFISFSSSWWHGGERRTGSRLYPPHQGLLLSTRHRIRDRVHSTEQYTKTRGNGEEINRLLNTRYLVGTNTLNYSSRSN